MTRSTRPKVVERAAERRFEATGIGPGIAIGPVVVRQNAPAPAILRERTGPAADEHARLAEAVSRSLRQLDKLRGRLLLLPEMAQAEIVPLIDAYRQMLGPSRLLRDTARRLEAEAISAEAAVSDAAEAIAAQLRAGIPADSAAGEGEAHEGARLAAEVAEIARRLIRNLAAQPFAGYSAFPPGTVLVAEQLRPADAALIDPSRVSGVVTEDGGATDHTAIMLRALGIPAVMGAAGVCAAASLAPANAPIIVDGGSGIVVVAPGAATLETARIGVAAYARERQKLARLRRLKAVTASGEPVELQANLELPAELPLIAQSGAAGIGLLRTEFLFINAETLPDEAAQFAVYREIVESMSGDPTTIRVLDWGGEKQSDALTQAGFLAGMGDLNPALGLRGLRLLLRAPELFEAQLAAILRASAHGPVRILLPMVTLVAEVQAAREILERVARRLRRRRVKLPSTLPPLGVMIETPAAALNADALALEADFLAIGTNDLAMYTLAVDRGAAEVADLYNSVHPAVLKLVARVASAALRLRRPVSLCGEIGGDPRLTPLLLGLGLRSLSTNASSVPLVKQAIRSAEIESCVRFARQVLDQTDPARVSALIAAFHAKGV